MADRKVDHLLIGGGIASANCARWLREAGGTGSVLLVGREPEPPYNRPTLTKKYLTGDEQRADAYFRKDEWWGEQDIELMTRVSVMGLDTETRTAKLSNGEEIEFGTALLATGANVRRLRVDGVGLEGIHYIRAYGNSDGIREELEQFGKRVVCIGGSYIGCEVAATLAAQGADCTIVMLEDQPLERTLGPEIGAWVTTQLTALGVRIHGGHELEAFEGTGSGDDGERVSRVRASGDLVLDADVVVVGAGVMPDAMLAQRAGLAIGERGGILCDVNLQSSVPGIYAAGDVCEYDSPHHVGTVRVEHWDVAFNHGKTAALNMLGQPTPHEAVPYFWTDLAGKFEIESVGPAYKWDEVIFRGKLDNPDFSAWFIDDGRVAQVATAGRSEDLEVGRKLIAAKTQLGARAKELADESVALAALTGL
ncbi:MAG: FAD-dependent oxidoreductase [Thermoleophilaceae bacterium]|nr:FAD-dependent oxidoreductase [Thermoleophilaceae bacterium]